MHLWFAYQGVSAINLMELPPYWSKVAAVFLSAISKQSSPSGSGGDQETVLPLGGGKFRRVKNVSLI